MKVYSNKVLLFVEDGQEFVVKIGFTTAPDWIEKTDLFEAAKKEGSLKVVEGSTFTEGEKKLAAEERAAFEAKIAELEAKLASKETESVETPAEVEEPIEEPRPTKSKK